MKNYLFSLYPKEYKEFNLQLRKDSDQCSKELYDDLKHMLFTEDIIKDIGINKVENREQNFRSKFYTIFVSGDEFLLSSDYIGPSIHWAQKAGLSEKEIIDFLMIYRTLGGYVLFPRGKRKNVKYYSPENKYGKRYPITINTARGGELGYYDRFDLTLYAIKKYYEKTQIENIYIEHGLENYSDWFDLFKGAYPFETFINFYKLQDFVNDIYEIYDLTTYNEFTLQYDILLNENAFIPNNKEEYIKYVNGVNQAISNRNARL